MGLIVQSKGSLESALSMLTRLLAVDGDGSGLDADTLDGSHAAAFEPAFSKNTAFNKDFGVTAGSVCEGNDARLSAGFPTGTIMLFGQTTPPTGWTKITDHNDKALRVVSGTAGSGGSVAFSTVMSSARLCSSVTATGTVGSTTLTITTMPSHDHFIASSDTSSSSLSSSNYLVRQSTVYSGDRAAYLAGSATVPNIGNSQSVGGGSSHTHGFTGTAHQHSTNLEIQYVDVVLASKD